MSIWKNTRRAVRRPIETSGFLILKAIIPLLPRRAVLGISGLFAKLVILMPLREKKIGLKNLDIVFGDTKTKKEKRVILETSLATFMQTLLDVLWFTRNAEKRMRKYVHLEESPESKEILNNKAAVCITAHIGNWEVMGQMFALEGVKMASIAAEVKNKTVNSSFVALREKTGQTIIPQAGAMKSLISHFRLNGKAAFVLDQYTSPKQGGITIDFLGQLMSVSSAPSAIAYRTGIPIFLGFCTPEEDGHYCIRITEIICPPPFDRSRDKAEETRELTQRIENSISEQILSAPQYWLWSYKYWTRCRKETRPENETVC